MRKLALLFSGFIIFQGLFAQNQKNIDSLLVSLNQTENDTNLVNQLNVMAADLYYVDHNQIYEYAQKALKLSQDIKYKKGIADAYNNLGIFYRSKGLYDFAIDYFFNSLEIMEQINDLAGVARCYNLIGIIYYYIGIYPLSLDYYNKALTINIEQNDKKWRAANYNNVGMVYEKMGEYGLALDFYFKSLEVNLELDNKYWIANNYGNIGSLYQITENPKSLDYFYKRLYLSEQLKDKGGISHSNFLIGRYYISHSEFEEAIVFLSRAFALSDSLGNLLQTNNIAKELSEAYAGLGKYKEAYQYQVLHKNLNDKLNLDESYQKITRLEMQYSYRKDQQINELIDQKTEFIQIILAVLLGIMILISILFIGRQRAKATNHDLEQKRLQIENKILKEELEFKNKSIQDNVQYLLDKNELINKVSDRLIREKPLFKPENQKIIEEVIFELQSNIEDDILEEFETRFHQVHDDFYTKLNKLAADLTPNDKKLCAFLKLKMSSKEISLITGQSINSIETARSRLRKKLNINSREVSLQDFLYQL